MSVGSDALGWVRPTALTARPQRPSWHLLPAGWRLFRSMAPCDELVIARYGAVEVRRVPAGFAAVTSVKGERLAAARTAFGRVADYAEGRNRGSVRLATRGPVTQVSAAAPSARGRWRVSVPIAGATGALVASAAGGGKVRIEPEAARTLAVVRVSARPTPALMASAEAAIFRAIPPGTWAADGPALIRMHSPPRSRLLGGWFEVAVPLAPLREDVPA
ncbi:MAG TPA: heme-binding protein [Acetobacteraceae bacterium]|jgi:hypothetical protein|nr:heme-binding protein [Acetobacteraceae bacterium]